MAVCGGVAFEFVRRKETAGLMTKPGRWRQINSEQIGTRGQADDVLSHNRRPHSETESDSTKIITFGACEG